MASIELRVATTVEFTLFEKFAYAIILFKEKRDEADISRPEFFSSLVRHLGMQTTGRHIENLFSKAKKVYSLEDWQYASFCKTFNDAYEALKPKEKDLYKELKVAFDAWKLSIDKRHGLDPGHEFGPESLSDKIKHPKTFPFNGLMADTNWYVYALHETWKSPVIGRMVMNFGEPYQDEVDVTLSHYDKNYGIWKGKAYLTVDASMAITITQEPYHKGYTHYLIAVWPQVTTHELFIGIMTRKNIKLTKIVSKIVLLERCHDAKPVATKFELDSTELPEGFSEFLLSDESKPLFGALLHISDHESFRAWLKEKKQNRQFR